MSNQRTWVCTRCGVTETLPARSAAVRKFCGECRVIEQRESVRRYRKANLDQVRERDREAARQRRQDPVYYAKMLRRSRENMRKRRAINPNYGR